MLSSASTQELEEALAARRVKSQAAREKNEREQKKPRLQGGLEPGLPGFGTQSARDGGGMSKEVDTAKARLDNLEEVTHHHNVAHKAAIARMDELEKELQVRKARASKPG